MATSAADLHRLATAIRLRGVRMVAPQGFGYLGQALSAAEQYAAVCGALLRHGTDRVVCSPGHYVVATSAAAETGLIDQTLLASYGQNGSALEAIGTERSPVPDYTCGSLGQGLSAGAGFALADRLQGRPEVRTFAFLSDGELQEGQVWEAATPALAAAGLLRASRGPGLCPERAGDQAAGHCDRAGGGCGPSGSSSRRRTTPSSARVSADRCAAWGWPARSPRARSPPRTCSAKYGLTTQHLAETAWSALGRPGPAG